MARDLAGESEFGLSSPMPLLGDETSAVGLPAFSDAQAVADGAVGQAAGPVGSVQQLGHELREIYAKGEGVLGPGTVGNSKLKP